MKTQKLVNCSKEDKKETSDAPASSTGQGLSAVEGLSRDASETGAVIEVIEFIEDIEVIATFKEGDDMGSREEIMDLIDGEEDLRELRDEFYSSDYVSNYLNSSHPGTNDTRPTRFIMGLFDWAYEQCDAHVPIAVSSHSIAGATKRTPECIRSILSRLVKTGLLERVSTGSIRDKRASVYKVPEVTDEVR